MKVIKTTIYQCSYCSKYYKMKHYCIRHEKECSGNPNNLHACYDCINLVVDRKFVDVESEGELTIKTFYCKILNINMHTCKAEARGFARVLNTFRMPIECKDKEQFKDFTEGY